MRAELTDKLFADYPKIFGKEENDVGRHFWGFECGDGWYNIIDCLCANIQHEIDWNNAEGKFSKYKPKEQRMEQVQALQVKEKFGGLRFYATNLTPEMNGAVRMAELISSRTCELCGAPAETDDGSSGWIFTECGSCKAARKEGK